MEVDPKQAIDIVEDNKNGIDIEEKYADYKKKFPKIFDSIVSGEFTAHPNWKQFFLYQIQKADEYKTGDKFKVDQEIGMTFGPLLGEKFNNLSKGDLKKAEKKARAKV